MLKLLATSIVRSRASSALQAARVLAQPIGEALVGEVEQRQGAGVGERVGDALPLLGRGVDAGGVVAAAVQHHHVTGGHRAQHVEHGLDVELAVRAEVGVAADGQAGGAEDLRVVGPGGRGQPHRRARLDGGHQVARHAQRAGTTGRVQRLDATVADGRVVGAEDEVTHRPGVGGITADGLVDLGGLRGEDASLGLTDGIEHRRRAGLVDIDTRGERHLVGSVVGAEALHQPQDGVGCLGLEISEQ